MEIARKVFYNSGVGSREISPGLVVVGKNWWLERHEYDGSEWWEYKTKPITPSKHVNTFNILYDLFEEEG